MASWEQELGVNNAVGAGSVCFIFCSMEQSLGK